MSHSKQPTLGPGVIIPKEIADLSDSEKIEFIQKIDPTVPTTAIKSRASIEKELARIIHGVWQEDRMDQVLAELVKPIR